MGEMRCRVCGLLQAEPTWGEDGACPTYLICACCGCEFGYEDAIPAGVQRHREQWLARGAPWDQPAERPASWVVDEQLRLAPSVYIRVLPGLPAAGAPPVQFTATGQGTHREGFVVEFVSVDGDRWVGNFQPGLGGADGVFFVSGCAARMIVLSSGQAYVVDARGRSLVDTFGGTITDVLHEPTRDRLLFGNGLWIECHGPGGCEWKTERISWDGMADVRLEDGRLRGEAFDPMNDGWAAFEVDLDDGSVVGGSYPAELPQP